MKKILVIDDDPEIADLAVLALRDFYEVRTAGDGKEGLASASSFRPDLVLCDIMMPGMHGFEVCQKLRSDKSLPGLKILMSSSKGYASDIQSALEAGADAYLVKPFALKDLIEKVDSLIGPGGAPPDDSPQSFRVRFWGARGSCPCGGRDTARYGGNTACTEIRAGGQILVIDCGTGIRELGLSLMREFKDKPFCVHLFVGHTHWDHIQGFPFFSPVYSKRNSLRVYSVRGAHGSLERVFSGSMASDYFPIPLSSLACDIQFIELQGPLDLPGVRVSYHHLNHPGVAIGFRIESQGRVVTYLSDHEAFRRLHGDNEMTRRQDEALIRFALGSDLLIAEAQYTLEEYQARRGWGHSTFDDAVALAVSAGARRLAVFHHDPEHTDDKMDACIEHCRRLAAQAGSKLECFGAREGESLSL
jgi:phosphoribosyl 1,2-cyclic phosphodiesterase/ActR/RegA family two-component response regulator